MKRAYFLSSCSTCQRILKELNLPECFELFDIKVNPIDVDTLDFVRSKVDSYEALFSKKALKFRSLNLDKMNLTEENCKKYILEEYTFLKRPVFIVDEDVFVGNSKKEIERLKQVINR
jgi:arsenate reductase (glutaredoxin)